MTLFSMMGAARFALVFAEGPVVLWEFAGCEHLAASSVTVTEVRVAPGMTALSGPFYQASIDRFATDLADLVAGELSGDRRLAVEGFDLPVIDALRSRNLELRSATDVFVAARLHKGPAELLAMHDAMRSVTSAVQAMREQIQPGRTEVEIWAELHRQLIADDGEYISTRLAQVGHRTFPYFNEAGTNETRPGDLFCIDTDAIGRHGYGVDFSRTFLCGDAAPTGSQLNLFSMAQEQLAHNAGLLEPGRSFESFAGAAWRVPDRFVPYGYYCLAHGLGLSGEYPYVPLRDRTAPYPFPGSFEPGMVVCVESYIGDPDTRQGVKVEDQYLITEQGADLMSTLPHTLVS